MQDNENFAAAFTWPRGRSRTWWRISLSRRTARPPLLVYKEGQPHPWESPYRPLDDHPRLFEELAALGQAVEDPAVAEWDATAQRKALQFTKDYGPLRYLTDVEQQPQLFGRRWVVGWRLEDFFREARELFEAMTLAFEIGQMRESGVDQAALWPNVFRLGGTLATQLQGTTIVPLLHRHTLELHQGYMPRDLASALWLQLFWSVTDNKPLRRCKGCVRLFAPGDTRQEYHDLNCRKRASVKRSPSYQKRAKTRKKEGKA